MNEEKQPSEHALFVQISNRILNEAYKFSIVSTVYDLGPEYLETDYSKISAQEIMTAIKSFLEGNPSNVGIAIFLNLLARYPVSMVRRQVSPLMQKLIGFTYHMGNPTKKQLEDGIERISMDNVAEWFQRSKATVKEYVDATEGEWRDLKLQVEQAQLRDEAKDIALKELVEEEKQRLLAEKQRDNQPNERTPLLPPEEDRC